MSFSHPGVSHPMVNHPAYAAYAQANEPAWAQGGMPSGSFCTFSVFSDGMQPNEQRHPHHHNMPIQVSGPSQAAMVPSFAVNTLPAGSFTQHPDAMVATFRQEDSSGEFDDSYGMEEESMEHMMEMCTDPVMRERLRTVHQAQEAASCEGATGLFACPFCEKNYRGKHARSIWRRHLQDKHAIPLSQQPRRTRWDGDANRPKNAEERRQRMLESKRRWARKKRMLDKLNSNGGKTTIGSDNKESDATENDTPGPDAESGADDDMEAKSAQAAPTKAPAETKKRSTTTKAGAEKKQRGMQQLKFHHLTTTDMPQFMDANGGNHASGAIQAVWTTMSAKGPGGMETSGSSSSRAGAPRNFSKHASMPVMPQQVMTTMFSAAGSPRRALGEVDNNAPKGRRLVRTSSMADAPEPKAKRRKSAASKTVDQQQPVSELMPAPDTFDAPARNTPVNRFSALYPTPPMSGDDKSLAARVFGGVKQEGAAMLSPPSSQHTYDSSPAMLMASGNLSGKHSMMSPVAPMRRPPQSPANNPFSLDQHKISPATSSRRVRDGFVEPPMSATRLTSAINAQSAASRRGADAGGDLSDVLMMSGGSPMAKGRRLPPLVKTPLRPSSSKEVTASATRPSGLGSASVRRLTRRNGMATPAQQERAGLSTFGLTPFDARTSVKGSVTRPSYYSRASPVRRDGGDQFSSPQHLNLTQSLGLAPHSTAKGSSSILGLSSLTGTPYVSSLMTANSPWPDSVPRRRFNTSEMMRGSRASAGEDDDDDGMGSIDMDGDDEDEDDGPAGGLQETPCRPAKHPQASSLGSPVSSQTRSTARSQTSSTTHANGGNGSSAGRSRQSGGASSHHRLSDLPPLSFKLSSPARTRDLSAREHSAAKVGSFDSALLAAEGGASDGSSNTDGTDELKVEDLI